MRGRADSPPPARRAAPPNPINDAEEYERHRALLLDSLSTLPLSPERTLPPAPSPLRAPAAGAPAAGAPAADGLAAGAWGAFARAGASSQTLVENERTRLLAESPPARQGGGFAFGMTEECVLPEGPFFAQPQVLSSADAEGQPAARRGHQRGEAADSPPPTPAAPHPECSRARSLPELAEGRAAEPGRAGTAP